MIDYDGYNYERFRQLAQDPTLSRYEKIGFPDSYRQGKEELIFQDIVSKLPLLSGRRKLHVLDIGAGCSGLQEQIADLCREADHRLFVSDSAEMLKLIDERPHQVKMPGLFPETADAILAQSGGVDVIICYSVLHCVFVDSNVWYFLDRIMELLNDGGQALIGDIPNHSKRKRFFASANGVEFHKKFMNTDQAPQVEFNRPEPGKIDDALLLSMVMRCQASGCDAYVVPQREGLPFANRRDDLIVRKP
jgi:2-polyprenyl-3-methyl-5-hydroxy-6-metoxy-1,4-benzoquinol methylase